MKPCKGLDRRARNGRDSEIAMIPGQCCGAECGYIYPSYRQQRGQVIDSNPLFNIIYIMRRHGMFGPVAFLGVPTSYSPLQA
jgi:hypothetical protein